LGAEIERGMGLVGRVKITDITGAAALLDDMPKV
jgi:hypothetical protein